MKISVSIIIFQLFSINVGLVDYNVRQYNLIIYLWVNKDTANQQTVIRLYGSQPVIYKD